MLVIFGRIGTWCCQINWLETSERAPDGGGFVPGSEDLPLARSHLKVQVKMSDQGDQMSLWKNRPKFGQIHFCQNLYMYNFYRGKNSPAVWATIVPVFKKLPKENNLPIRENWPNLVTLFLMPLSWSRFTSLKLLHKVRPATVFHQRRKLQIIRFIPGYEIEYKKQFPMYSGYKQQTNLGTKLLPMYIHNHARKWGTDFWNVFTYVHLCIHRNSLVERIPTYKRNSIVCIYICNYVYACRCVCF
jgi:hypothetical protein